MEIKGFTLMQKLLSCANSSFLDRSFYEIAYYLLLHYNEIETIPLKAVMRDCFVSSSTVRRFCLSLGYENYTDLREAKANNQEDQSKIARWNQKKGRYEPRVLHEQISEITWQLGRSINRTQLRQLAANFSEATFSILFAIRPYTLYLEEFQCQMMSMGKPVYILEETDRYETLIKRLGADVNNMVVSPTGGILSAIGTRVSMLPGKKTLMICPEYTESEDTSDLLSLYDTIVPLKIKTWDIEYMELYGKYAVACWFEILLGEILNQKSAME